MTEMPPLVALVGNPNAGKSALFNALTGARQKIANYPGVTVERKSGRAPFADGRPVEMIDLPGAYSLSPDSLDEAVTRDVVLGNLQGHRRPDALVIVLDAGNLDNHLRFALELIARGHRLVADDATKFSRIGPEQISGACPEILQDFLEVRGLGIINVRNTYGDSSIKDEKILRLIVRLEAMDRARLLQLDRLDGGSTIQNILEVDIPELTLPVAPGRNLAVLLECAVRNHILKIRGYNAPADFINKQQGLINQNHD